MVTELKNLKKSDKPDPFISVLKNPTIVGKICSHLSTLDLDECLLVCKDWRKALLCYSRINLVASITGPDLREMKSESRSLADMFKKEYKYTTKMIVRGWDPICNVIDDEFYNTLIDTPNQIKKLVLRGRGAWSSCKCPQTTNGFKGNKEPKVIMTNLEVLIVDETFTITCCALMHVLSRSPKLKQLTFFGRCRRHDHLEGFKSKILRSNLQRLYWPLATRKDRPVINYIVKHNDETLQIMHTSMEVTCELLSQEYLTRLKHLSLNLTEDWVGPEKAGVKQDKAVRIRKAYEHLERTKNLALAKGIESLEMRTFPFDLSDEDKEFKTKIERIYENYRLSFWENLAKLPKLKYICVYGAWELDNVCTALAKHGFGIEYLRTNCIPNSLADVIYDDSLNNILSMPQLIKDIRKLTSLRSIYYHCAERLFNIDQPTINAFKELIDKLWFLNVKTTNWTSEIDDFLTALIKRGNQSGKFYTVDVYIEPVNPLYADTVITLPLKLPPGTSLKGYILNNARAEVRKKYRCDLQAIYCWGARLSDMPRDRASYEAIKLTWNKYRDIFDATNYGC